ncbi:MAG: ferrous iron transport protein B, partial [Epsilonproteobacteria bacterium]|nr:ferrous iron transport protein B [Campylobacterota bacterium]
TYNEEIYPQIQYSAEIENILLSLEGCLKEYQFSKRFMALRFLDEDPDIYKRTHEAPFFTECIPLLNTIKKELKNSRNETDTQSILNNERVAIRKGLMRQVMQNAKQESLSDKIDTLLIHPLLGLPIFLFFMWAIFQLTFSVGSIPMDYIDMSFEKIGILVAEVLPQGVVSDAIVNGIIPAVGAVVMFLPNILILFLGINLLEQTGYMARSAYVMDGVLKKFGLQGRSFVPLVSGFGCTVPAYMAARTLKNPKDRIITMLVLGFMSCGARLPVYTLLVGTFFHQSIQGNVMFTIYIGGALMGLIAAKILRLTLFKGKSEPFAMEMPKYRLPTIKAIFLDLWIKAKTYLKKAGTFIAVAAFMVWFLSSYPQNSKALLEIEGEREKNSYILENSYLSQLGQTIEPIFTPLGFGWKESVAVLSGLAAKEVMVSTMAVLYHSDEEDERLGDVIKSHIPFAVAVAMILFVMFYSPCFASIGTFFAEVSQWKWRLFYLVYPNLFAWLAAFVGYQLAL